MKATTPIGSVPAKIVASVLVLACVAIGIVGLVLPIIPGLIFLAIAAVIAARYYPSVHALMRRHRATARHLHAADSFARLSPAEKFQIAGWYCAKLVLDGLAQARALLAKLRGGI